MKKLSLSLPFYIYVIKLTGSCLSILEIKKKIFSKKKFYTNV